MNKKFDLTYKGHYEVVEYDPFSDILTKNDFYLKRLDKTDTSDFGQSEIEQKL